MGQTWHDLLFAHWPLPPAAVERLIPRPLALDTFDGRAWLGITPFVLSGLRLAATPPLPALSTFPELNVRTYVSAGGKPGIFFFSLDAASRLAVTTARRLYRLPYFLAEMSVRQSGPQVLYRSKRADDRGRAAELSATYWPTGGRFFPKPGSLEHFLVERYCLYSVDDGGEPLRAEIHHPPWALQPAEAEIEHNSMAPPGLELPNEPPLLHFGKRQDVLIWRAARAGR